MALGASGLAVGMMAMAPAVAAPVGPDAAALNRLAEITRCVVQRDPKRSRLVLLKADRLDAYTNLIAGHDNCLGYREGLHAGGVMVGGDLAEALIAHDGVDAARLRDAAARSPMPDVGQWSRCVVRAQPDLTMALLSTLRGSAAEQDAASALRDALAACVRTGATLSASVAGARAMLAVAAYRIASEYPAPTSAGL